jgi:hypothetical protein
MSFVKTTKATKYYSGQRVDVADMQTNLLQYLIDNTRHMEIKCLGEGVISGLAITDGSLNISETNITSTIATLKGNASNKLCQIFKATSSNIQKIYLNAKQDGTAVGSLTLSICPITDPTDSHSVIQYTSSVAQVSIAETVLTTNYADIEFDFQTTAAGANGALTVGNYYALVITSNTTAGTITFRYNDDPDYNYVYGFIREVTSGITTDHDAYDLYFKIYSDTVTLSAGFAYKEGQPVIVPLAVSNIDLVETTGSDNFVCIRFKGTLTDLEVNPTWGNMEYSRTEDSYEISVFNTAFTLIDSSWLILYKLNHSAGTSVTITDMRAIMPRSDVSSNVYIQYESAAGTNQTRTIANIPYQSDYSAPITAGTLSQIKVYIEENEVTSKGFGTGTPAAGTVNINPATRTLTFNSADVVTGTKVFADYYASLTAYKNKFTVQDFEVLGNAVFNGNIKLIGNISLDQTSIDSSSTTEDDDYVGAETNLKEDLDRVKREIKTMKGYGVGVGWRTAAPSSLLQSDYDLAGYTGEGIVKDVKDAALGKLDYAVTTGFSFTIATGKSIINKKITAFNPATTLTLANPDGFVSVVSETNNFPTNNAYEKVTLSNIHKILTITNALSDVMRYGVDGCTFAVDGSNLVITKSVGHKFLIGDYITITHSNTYTTTTPIIITSVSANTITVANSYSHAASTYADDLDGFVLLDTNGGATTELAVDVYSSCKVLRIITGSTQQNNVYNYSYALPRYDVVQIGNDGVVSIVKGTAAASPVIPSVTDINHQKLYEVYVEEMLDNAAGNYYTAYMSGDHNNRLNTIKNAFIDKRTFLQKNTEYEYSSVMDVFVSSNTHYDLRIKRLFRYKSDARIKNIDIIDAHNGDLNSQIIYNDDIGNTGTDKIATFIYSHNEGKVYIKTLSYHQTYYFLSQDQHLTLLAERAKGYILTSYNGTQYLIKVDANETITTLTPTGISAGVITDVDHDIDLGIFGNGFLTQDSSTQVIHKIFGNDARQILSIQLNSDYVTDGFTNNTLNSLNYIRILNPKLGMAYRSEMGNQYRIQVSDTGILTATAV